MLDTESIVFEVTAPLGAPSCSLSRTGSDSSWPLSVGGARLTPSEAWRVTSVRWYQLWGKSTQALWYQHPQLQAQKLPQLWSKIRLLEGWGFPSTASQTPSGVGHPAGCKWRPSVTQNNKVSLHLAANAQQL